jgi:hypothetical protein
VSFVAAILVVLAMVFAGLTLHRALAIRLLAVDRDGADVPGPSERDLLLWGILLGIAIVGTIGLYLALFEIVAAWSLAIVCVAAVLWRRRDAEAMLLAIRELG